MEEIELKLDLKNEENRKILESIPNNQFSNVFEKTLTIQDITIEKFVQVLKSNPAGVISIQDEMISFFDQLNQYKKNGNDVGYWLKVYNGNLLKIDRKTDGSKLIPYSGASIIGGIQTELLCLSFKENPKYAYNGLFHRFLYAFPEKRRKERSPGMPQRSYNIWSRTANELFEYRESIFLDVNDPYNQPVETLNENDCFSTAKQNLPLYSEPRNLERKKYSLSDEAQAIFDDFWEEMNEIEFESKNTIYAEFTSKIIGAVGRIALVLWIVKNIDYKNMPTEIDDETMKNAVEIAFWFDNEEKRVLQDIMFSPLREQQDKEFSLSEEKEIIKEKIVKILARKAAFTAKKAVTRRNLKRCHLKGISDKGCEICLKELIKENRIKMEVNSNRQGEVYWLCSRTLKKLN